MVLTLVCANVHVDAFINVQEMWKHCILSTVTLENKGYHSVFSFHCVSPRWGSMRPLLYHSKLDIRPGICNLSSCLFPDILLLLLAQPYNIVKTKWSEAQEKDINFVLKWWCKSKGSFWKQNDTAVMSCEVLWGVFGFVVNVSEKQWNHSATSAFLNADPPLPPVGAVCSKKTQYQTACMNGSIYCSVRSHSQNRSVWLWFTEQHKQACNVEALTKTKMGTHIYCCSRRPTDTDLVSHYEANSPSSGYQGTFSVGTFSPEIVSFWLIAATPNSFW